MDPDNYAAGGRDPNDTNNPNAPDDNVVGTFKVADPNLSLGASWNAALTFNAGDTNKTTQVTMDKRWNYA